jgi:hypothetical protein
MKTPLGRIVRERERSDVDHAIGEALRRVRLAIGEVRVVERKQDGQVLSRAVVNKDALQRAQRTYMAACALVGKARQADGTTAGPRRPDRLSIRQAEETLAGYAHQIAGFLGLP